MTMQTLHATCVDIDGQGVLITGRSGSGKSTLALHLIALGANLVADDQTEVFVEDACLTARRPATLPPLIEARGVGLLTAPIIAKSLVKLAIDMDTIEAERLPTARHVTYLGCDIPLLHRVEGLHFPPAILLMIRHGRRMP